MVVLDGGSIGLQIGLGETDVICGWSAFVALPAVLAMDTHRRASATIAAPTPAR